MLKVVRFLYLNEIKYGILLEEKILELEGDYLKTLNKSGKVYDLFDVKLLSPCEPSKIICVGLNYYVPGSDTLKPSYPLLFMKPSTSIVGPDDSIVKFPMVEEIGYEGELAVVIGKKAHNITIEDAKNYIFGYTIANDVTAKDLQRVDSQWTRAKSFDTFLPLGPCIVKNIDWCGAQIKTLLNGKVVQEGNTDQMMFSIPYLVSYVSQIMTLLPGDIILTGTPGGKGGLMTPGDVVEIQVDKIGKLVNKVV